MTSSRRRVRLPWYCVHESGGAAASTMVAAALVAIAALLAFLGLVFSGAWAVGMIALGVAVVAGVNTWAAGRTLRWFDRGRPDAGEPGVTAAPAPGAALGRTASSVAPTPMPPRSTAGGRPPSAPGPPSAVPQPPLPGPPRPAHQPVAAAVRPVSAAATPVPAAALPVPAAARPVAAAGPSRSLPPRSPSAGPAAAPTVPARPAPPVVPVPNPVQLTPHAAPSEAPTVDARTSEASGDVDERPTVREAARAARVRTRTGGSGRGRRVAGSRPD